MINDWDRRFPGRIENMFRSLRNVVPSHLADTRLYDFAGLRVGAALPDEGGDTAFDSETFSDPTAPVFDDEEAAPATVRRPVINILDTRVAGGCGE